MTKALLVEDVIIRRGISGMLIRSIALARGIALERMDVTGIVASSYGAAAACIAICPSE